MVAKLRQGMDMDTMLTIIWIILAGILTFVILYQFIPTPTEFSYEHRSSPNVLAHIIDHIQSHPHPASYKIFHNAHEKLSKPLGLFRSY